MIRKGAPIILLLLLLASQVLVSQELLKPVLKFTNACASNSFNMYDVEVTYIASTFNTDNIFYLELSNASGDFSSPTVLKTVANKNSSFRFTTTFNLPQTTAGNGYKIRVKSSSPEKISPESDAFEAYFMSSEMLVLNNFEDVTICEGESKEISVTNTSINQIQWYKNGQKFLLGDSTISVNEAGLYYCEIYYGSCNSSATSNIIEVKKIASVDAELKGASEVNICVNDTYTLEAKTNNNLYSYSWYKNDIKIDGLPSYTPSLIVSESANYYLEITNDNGCISKSNVVNVNQIDTDFSINITSTTPTFILEGESKVLSIYHDAENAEITWFKDNVAVPNSNTKELSITDSGIYFAEIKNTKIGCSTIKKTENIIVNNIQSITGTINTSSNYTACNSEETEIVLENVTVTDTDSTVFDLSINQIELLKFKWFKENTLINGINTKAIIIESFEKNGNYTLEISNGRITSKTNTVEISLGLLPIEITSNDTSNTFCNNKQIILSTEPKNGFSYQWFLDGNAIDNATNNNLIVFETGIYKLETSGYNCSITSQEITINAFNENDVVFNFDDEITLQEGESIILSANGADTYEWTNENAEVIGSSSSIEISSGGTYTVNAILNNCIVQKKVTVVLILSNTVVPNILTPNGDGVNDYWKIPNEFSFKNNVEIEIISNNGVTVLKQKNYQNNWPENNTNIGSLYFYIIKKESNVIKKGTITVIK